MLKDLLAKHNFRFNKALGQNFITDVNLLDAIADDAQLSSDDTVVEIGAGAGTLTLALAKRARKIIAFEVDKRLEPVIYEQLKGFDNVEVVFCDVLCMNDTEIIHKTNGEFHVVANLPYYITTPLIMRFLESSLPWKSLTVMMQLEVAKRLTAKANTADYGAITAAAAYYGEAKITRNVNRKMFYPAPEVDSAVVRLEVKKNALDADEATYKKLVKAAFMWRRKTLANNISTAFKIPKADAERVLTDLGFLPAVRGEALSPNEFAKVARNLSK